MDVANVKQLKKIVSEFRVTELQSLLNYAGRNKFGRKSELLQRALELVESGQCSTPITFKIHQLSRCRRSTTATSPVPGYSSRSSANVSAANPPVRSPSRSVIQQVETRPQPSVIEQVPLASSSTAAGSPPSSLGPFHPDVRFKHLPFYDVKRELLKPSSLSAVATTASMTKNYYRAVFTFCLTPHQVSKIIKSRNELLSDDCGIVDYGIQIQLRICLAETTCDQDDHFPPNVMVRVNHQEVQLPSLIPSNKQGVEPKRPGRPLNITSTTKLCSSAQNTIHVTWSHDMNQQNYCIAVYLVKQLTSLDLLNRLKQTVGVRHPDHTRALIKEKLAQSLDSEISTTSLRISLLCPLSKTRMVVPCRPNSCRHLQCFDASSFLQMNEKKSTWLCPVCDKPADFSSLIIDGLFTEILEQASDSNDIQFAASGQWTCLKAKEDRSKTADRSIIETIPDSPEPSRAVDTIDLTETDDEEDIRPVSRVSSTCLSSDSSELVIMSIESAEPHLPSGLKKGERSRESPPVLSHFLDIDPWNYYFSKSSHSATSATAATSGDLHAVMRHSELEPMIEKRRGSFSEPDGDAPTLLSSRNDDVASQADSESSGGETEPLDDETDLKKNETDIISVD